MAWSPSLAKTSEHAARLLPSWIEGFVDFTADTQSPLLFRKWSAVSSIAGALERKVWIKAFKRTLFPNLYVLLVGGPGIGKTDSLRNVIELWNRLQPTLHVAPSSVSRASLIDDLASADRTVVRPGESDPVNKFHALNVAATEFGTFLTSYETEFMSTLNDLFDCVRYKERKRHMKEPIVLDRPVLNLIAGTTPAWLGGTLPENAWAEGFSSRLLMIFSGEMVRIDPWAASSVDDSILEALVHDLKNIHEMWGQFSFEPEVADAFRHWYLKGCPPEPDHPKFEHYLPRRHTHFLKLCMVMSASRSPDLIIRMSDYQAAMDLLFEAEAYMPDVFKAMRTSTDSNVMDDCFQFVWIDFCKTERPMAEHRIVNFLRERLPTHSVQKVLEIMVASGILEIVNISGDRGRAMYRPVPRAQHGR